MKQNLFTLISEIRQYPRMILDLQGNINAGENVRITITDNGTGIDKSIMDKIFDPYFTTKPTGKGTGLGLFTVLKIIKEHSGGVKVYSELGMGTTFTIYLPKAETVSISTTQTTSDSLKGREQLLIVDDEESILEISKISLELLGYKVEVTFSPNAARELIRLNPERFNLII